MTSKAEAGFERQVTAHKQPFAPMLLDTEPTKDNVFWRTHNRRGHEHDGQGGCEPVRVFIGPLGTDWMQQHQRWWVRTAGRLEAKENTGKKIRRRTHKPSSLLDGSRELFSETRSHKHRRNRWSLGTASSPSQPEASDVGVISAQDSDWSSLLLDSDDDDNSSDDNIAQTEAVPHNEPQDNTHATLLSPGTPRHAPPSSGPGRNSIPMPALSSSPHQPPLLSAPLHGSSTAAEHVDGTTQSHARRRNSLNTLKGLFRRHSTTRPKPRTSSEVSEPGNRRSLDTILSVPSRNESSLGSASQNQGRGRATSASQVATASGGLNTNDQTLTTRNSIDGNLISPRLASLRRLAVTRGSRSSTWQSSADSDFAKGVMIEALPPTSSITPADIQLQLMRMAGRIDSSTSRTSSRVFRSRRAVVAKIKAHLTRHAQLSETTVILSSRVVVRREVVSKDAFCERYNETTYRQFRQSTQEWAEMWMALTKRGILFYLASKKRPTVAVLFPPYGSIAPRVSLFSTLDMSLGIVFQKHSSSSSAAADSKAKGTTGGVSMEDSESGKGVLHAVIIKFPSSQVACEWYREIGQALLVGRVMYPSHFLNDIPPAAQPPPTTVVVNVPEMGIKVQVKLGQHRMEVPSSVLLGGADDALLERQWRCEATTAWHIRREVANVLLSDKVVGPTMREWLDAERDGRLTIGMAWRRYDRLDWIMPCGALDAQGDFKVDSVNDKVIGPQLLEGTHALELRLLEHYPDSVAVDGGTTHEPVGVEGFVLLKRDKRHRTEIVTYRPALLTSHDGFLFFIHAPRAERHLDICDHHSNSQPHSAGVLHETNTLRATYSPQHKHEGMARKSLDTPEQDQDIRYYHPDERNCSKQVSMAKYMVNITEVEHIVPMLQDSGDLDPEEGHSPADKNDAGSIVSGPTTTEASQDTRVSHRERAKGKLRGFLRLRKNRESACKFKLVTRAGAEVVLWAANERCMREWVHRLTELRFYWINRLVADFALNSQVCMLNYSIQGRCSKYQGEMEWNDEGSWAERAVWNACLMLGCRTIIKAGVLYRKRHRHQGMCRVFCILTQGRLVEFEYPRAPTDPRQTVLAELMVRNDASMSQVFRGIRDSHSGRPTSADAPGSTTEATATKGASNSDASLLFAKSRSLSLRQCYVVSRFTDDLSTHDIMCEPWVRTDIGNYNGLRLADRIYADGTISHELITDCIFTVWRPTFVPQVLRSSVNPELKHIQGDLSDASELSADDRLSVDAVTSGYSSPSPSVKRPGWAAPSSPSRPLTAGISTPATTGNHHRQLSLSHHRHQRSSSYDVRYQPANVGHRDSPITTPRTSGDVPRISVDGCYSAASNGSSSPSSRQKGSTSKPGAYRVGNEIRLSIDDKHDGKKRMGAIGMASSMRRREGVYKARTNAEMAQWVTAINQEIRRMALAER
ncbi:hypothetical protein H4R24_005717 [Coemansia sp. RSA 988]|nr:hypothetical protein H4R24_005717 [Coemansia sp. RSA 988]